MLIIKKIIKSSLIHLSPAVSENLRQIPCCQMKVRIYSTNDISRVIYTPKRVFAFK